MTTTLAALADADKKHKPAGANEEWRRAAAYYYDTSRQLTVELLRRLGLGIKDDGRPLEVGIMQRIIEEQAVIYDSPPARYLVRNRQRLSEDSPEVVAMGEAYEASGVDLVLREADRLRALYRQVFVRLYPVHETSTVTPRLFPPQNVRRIPNPSTPDIISTSKAVGLLLEGEPDKDGELWEVWTNLGGSWSMRWVGHKDAVAWDPGEAVRYARLPMLAMWDREPCGMPWLPPRQSRNAFIEKLAQSAAELQVMVQLEAHDQTVVEAEDPRDVPREGGPGTTWALPKGSNAQILSRNPKIQDSIEVMREQLKLLVLSESLPLGLFDDQRQVVTGAALRVQLGPLEDRRTAQAPLAIRDERELWKIYVAEHNDHAGSWGKDALAADTTMDVELADLNIPIDPREAQQASASAIALGTRSVIDVIQAEHRCTRPQALRVYERVKADLLSYPPPSKPGAQIEGPRLAGVERGPEAPSVLPVGRLDQGGKPSVLQNVQGLAQ